LLYTACNENSFYFFLVIILFFLLFFSCQRPINPEAELPSNGFLIKDDNGNCKPVSVNGNYVVGEELSDSNTLEVQVNVTFPGLYTVSIEFIVDYLL
jgi:hypothetical protein